MSQEEYREFQSQAIEEYASREDVDLDKKIYRLCTHDFLFALDDMDLNEEQNQQVLSDYDADEIEGKIEFEWMEVLKDVIRYRLLKE